jgi:phosphoribosylanthranilate isomerase
VKICGLTRPEDVALAVELGASAVGFNFAAGSPRRVDVRDAESLSDAAGEADRVGVFRDEPAESVRAAIEKGHLRFLQFHRALQERDLAYPLAVIAVCEVSGRELWLPPQTLLGRCHALLCDSAETRHEGARAPFRWRNLEGVSWPALPLWLAGGLTPENVGGAIRLLRPALVDVSSGVERETGRKDPARMRAFFDAVRRADGEA